MLDANCVITLSNVCRSEIHIPCETAPQKITLPKTKKPSKSLKTIFRSSSQTLELGGFYLMTEKLFLIIPVQG